MLTYIYIYIYIYICRDQRSSKTIKFSKTFTDTNPEIKKGLNPNQNNLYYKGSEQRLSKLFSISRKRHKV